MSEEYKQYEIPPLTDSQQIDTQQQIASALAAAGISNREMKSPNFQGGVRGWMIGANGDVEFNNGVFRGQLKIGGLIINVATTESIQDAIDTVHAAGGGQVILANGTHYQTADITLYSDTDLIGQNSDSAIIDFGNGAYSIKAIGSNAYTTGTISTTTGTTTVTGSGTTFTAAMVGRSILLSGVWYVISGFTSTTVISIALPFADTTLAASTYTIASILADININNLTIQNSTASGISFQYTRTFHTDGLRFINCATGITGQTSMNFLCTNQDIVYCGVGMALTACSLSEVDKTGIIDSTTTGMTLVSCSKMVIRDDYVLGSVGNGISVTSCNTIVFKDVVSKNNGGKGIELISGNTNIQINANCSNNASDGIKFTATAVDCDILTCQLNTNGGYGWNIANANCTTNHAIGNHFTGNISGTYIDSGTGTIIAEGAITGATDANLTTSDITTNNVSTSKHGFAPKAPNVATQFLDGTGNYSTPANVMTLLKANSGTTTTTSDHDMDTASISGLTAKDKLFIVWEASEITQSCGRIDFMKAAAVFVAYGASGLVANNYASGTATLRQAQFAVDTVIGDYDYAGAGSSTAGNANNTKARNSTSVDDNGDWTGSWTLNFRNAGVTSGGTTRWSWSVYKIAGQ